MGHGYVHSHPSVSTWSSRPQPLTAGGVPGRCLRRATPRSRRELGAPPNPSPGPNPNPSPSPSPSPDPNSGPNPDPTPTPTPNQVSSELFASPLNCRFPRFCSAAADADEPFGSAGSFFDCDLRSGAPCPPPPLRPRAALQASSQAATPCIQAATPCVSGAYLANPPFDPTVVERMIIRMEELLDTADQACMHARWLSPLPFSYPAPAHTCAP